MFGGLGGAGDERIVQPKPAQFDPNVLGVLHAPRQQFAPLVAGWAVACGLSVAHQD